MSDFAESAVEDAGLAETLASTLRCHGIGVQDEKQIEADPCRSTTLRLKVGAGDTPICQQTAPGHESQPGYHARLGAEFIGEIRLNVYVSNQPQTDTGTSIG